MQRQAENAFYCSVILPLTTKRDHMTQKQSFQVSNTAILNFIYFLDEWSRIRLFMYNFS